MGSSKQSTSLGTLSTNRRPESLLSGEQKPWLTKLQVDRQSKICTKAQKESSKFRLLGPAVNQSEMCSGLAAGDFNNAKKIW